MLKIRMGGEESQSARAPALVSRVFAPTVDMLVRPFSGGRDILYLRGIYHVLDIHA